MGRILFLSAVAYLAYRYIGRSNQKHQQIASQNGVEVLPPATTVAALPAPATETKALPAGRSSLAAESDPQR